MSVTGNRAGRRADGEKGATAVEYGLIITGIAAVIVVAIAFLGGGLSGGYTDAAEALPSSSAPGPGQSAAASDAGSPPADAGTPAAGAGSGAPESTGPKESNPKDSGSSETGTAPSGTKDTGTRDTGTKDTGTNQSDSTPAGNKGSDNKGSDQKGSDQKGSDQKGSDNTSDGPRLEDQQCRTDQVTNARGNCQDGVSYCEKQGQKFDPSTRACLTPPDRVCTKNNRVDDCQQTILGDGQTYAQHPGTTVTYRAFPEDAEIPEGASAEVVDAKIAWSTWRDDEPRLMVSADAVTVSVPKVDREGSIAIDYTVRVTSVWNGSKVSFLSTSRFYIKVEA